MGGRETNWGVGLRITVKSYRPFEVARRSPMEQQESLVRFEVRVELKPGIEDPEALSIQKSLSLLGIGGLHSVATARVYRLEFAGVATDEARRRADRAVDQLLANPVIHRVSIVPGAP